MKRKLCAWKTFSSEKITTWNIHKGYEILDEVKKSGTLAVDLHESVQAAIDILNKMDGVEVDRPFWNDSKPMQWLKMPEASCLS